jgi:hypothetical protein
MAGIDYTIPGQFKGIQLESPMNQMAQAMQLRGLQESSQMNALRTQEYELKTQEAKETSRQRNALAAYLANPKKPTDPLELEAGVRGVAPLLADKFIDDQLRRADLGIRTEEHRAKIDANKLLREQRAAELTKEQFQDAVSDLISYDTVGQVKTALAQKVTAKQITQAQADQVTARLPKDDAGITAWQIATMRNMLTPKERYAEIRARQDEKYNSYKNAQIFKGSPFLSQEDFERQAPTATQATTPASAPAPAPADAPADAAAASAEVTTAPDGTKTFSGVTKVGTKQGFEYLDVTAQRLLQLAATAKTDKEAAAYKAAAEKIQAAHVKFLEDQEKRNRPTGEFFNVPLARKKIQELRKLPATEENLTAINDQLDLIKTAKEGNAPRVSNVIKMPEGVKAVDQKYAQDYLDWTQGGGADAAANSAQIKMVLDRFANGEVLSGVSIGLAPDFFNALVNPDALSAKQAVQEVVQRNLRAVLGTQFTQVEGENLVNRAFDPRLKPQENAKRLRKLFLQMQTAAQQKQAMAEYYEANETLRGFKGKQPKMQDFFSVLTAPDAPPKGSIDVKAPDGKVYRFSDQQAADKFKKDNGIKD